MYTETHNGVFVTYDHLKQSNRFYDDLGSVLMGDGRDDERAAGQYIHKSRLLATTVFGSYMLAYVPHFRTSDRKGWQLGWQEGYETHDKGVFYLCPDCATKWLRERQAEEDDGVEYAVQPTTVFGDGEDVTCDDCYAVIVEG